MKLLLILLNLVYAQEVKIDKSQAMDIRGEMLVLNFFILKDHVRGTFGSIFNGLEYPEEVNEDLKLHRKKFEVYSSILRSNSPRRAKRFPSLVERIGKALESEQKPGAK